MTDLVSRAVEPRASDPSDKTKRATRGRLVLFFAGTSTAVAQLIEYTATRRFALGMAGIR